MGLTDITIMVGKKSIETKLLAVSEWISTTVALTGTAYWNKHCHSQPVDD